MAYKGIEVTDGLIDYLLAHSLPRSDAHQDLVRVTWDTMGDRAGMQISPEQGPFLTLLVRLVGVRTAVEVGTFTGLSALCIAEGLADDGRLTCFDISEEFTSVGRRHWERAGVSDRIDLIIGPASDTLAAFSPPEPIDFAFIDADKGGYRTYYERILELTRPGGLIVVDNALWGGAVADPLSERPQVEVIRDFNDAVAADDRVDATLLNVGDGLMLARKR